MIHCQMQQQQQQQQQRLREAHKTSVASRKKPAAAVEVYDSDSGSLNLETMPNSMDRMHNNNSNSGSSASNSNPKSSDYLLKRQKNNESARKCREMKKVRDMIQNKRTMILQEENERLFKELKNLYSQNQKLINCILTIDNIQNNPDSPPGAKVAMNSLNKVHNYETNSPKHLNLPNSPKLNIQNFQPNQNYMMPSGPINMQKDFAVNPLATINMQAMVNKSHEIHPVPDHHKQNQNPVSAIKKVHPAMMMNMTDDYAMNLYF